MFDIGFSEMLLIAVVALVVIGPERLPKVARTMGHMFARLQRYVNDVKADINREMELDELRKFKSEFENAAQSVESTFRAEVAGAESQINSIAGELTTAAEAPLAQSGESTLAAPETSVAEPVQADLFVPGSNADHPVAGSEPPATPVKSKTAA
ncbi:MAG: Sec-independent protein translocase subunit TatB [Betaproteobacteria bacterium]|nr:Sec-independent protein translocase subunit TatB [Betaproteobacteria bacterium]